MYTLILTVIMTAGQYNALAADSTVTAIDGFQSQRQCLEAGNSWLAQARQNNSNMIRERHMALCVRKGE